MVRKHDGDDSHFMERPRPRKRTLSEAVGRKHDHLAHDSASTGVKPSQRGLKGPGITFDLRVRQRVAYLHGDPLKYQ
jgi:hypothetical protein